MCFRTVMQFFCAVSKQGIPTLLIMFQVSQQLNWCLQKLVLLSSVGLDCFWETSCDEKRGELQPINRLSVWGKKQRGKEKERVPRSTKGQFTGYVNWGNGFAIGDANIKIVPQNALFSRLRKASLLLPSRQTFLSNGSSCIQEFFFF